MQVHFGKASLKAEWPASVVCVGAFDGVHLGHRAVIGAGLEAARRDELPCGVVTFDRHPAAVLAPDRAPACLASLDQNLAQLDRLGVDFVLVLAFDLALSQTSATEFLEDILVGSCRAKRLAVGHDFALGRGREGSTAWLSERIATDVVPAWLIEGERVSSTAIREAVAQGQVERAQTLLGRSFEIAGIVVQGDRIGRTLGFPTVNLARSVNQVIPADGVYGGVARTPFGEFKAAISVGTRPSVGGVALAIEAFLLSYPGDSLYGRSVELEFHTRIRGQERFSSLEALKEQMDKDVQLIASGVRA